MEVVELQIVGLMSEDAIEKVVNCIKANVELILPNERIRVEGLSVEARIVD